MKNKIHYIRYSIVLTLIIAGSIAVATFIESSVGNTMARKYVYNALWFEIILLIWAVILLISLWKFKMIQWKKTGIFLFHFSFIFILIGAAVTRYTGKEGVIHLREGEKNQIFINQENQKQYQLPFIVELEDFKVEKYPGSGSPSSYISSVNILNDKGEVLKTNEIFMNNVLILHGYRLYQSSYDTDEKGSLLFVNRDVWGTRLTYLGYLLMSLGMALALFTGNSRFRYLSRQIRKMNTATVLFLMLMVGHTAFSQNRHEQYLVSKEQAKEFGKTMVQDYNGRIKPINTLSEELLRKIYGKIRFQSSSADQLVLSMITYPDYWKLQDLIKIKNPYIQKELSIETEYASMADFYFDNNNQYAYKLGEVVRQAYGKSPSERNKFDNEIIKIDEKANLCYLILSQDIFRFFPDSSKENNTWISPRTPTGLKDTTKLFVQNILNFYTLSLQSGEDEQATQFLYSIHQYQQLHGKRVMPSERKQKTELLYNQWHIFKKLFPVSLLLGSIFMFLFFIDIVKQREYKKFAVTTLIILSFIVFFALSFGLVLRAYISGHAPWSNGYESMIYIAWVSLLVGLIMMRKNPFVLAISLFFTGLLLFVAHLSWLNPEITNLVPVLKSYWLTIHVAVITASYGFLAVATLTAFLNLILFISKNETNGLYLKQQIQKLSYMAELCTIVGLYLLSIGTILGAVWGNYSWGRYWAWDPKETWALVSILVYTALVHLRLIPKMNNLLTFNISTLFAFLSIIMTYLGVNYLLSGLHSYASGSIVHFPVWPFVLLAVMIIVSAGAIWKEQKVKRN